MTKDLEEASGGGNRKDWFQGGCPELSRVERWSASNCRRNVLNLAISTKGTTLDKN